MQTDSNQRRALGLLALALLLCATLPSAAQEVTAMPILGRVEYIFLDDPADFWSSGTIIVEGTPVIIPRNLLIDLPANRLTLWQIFQDAPPACLATAETGLAMTDVCLEGREGGNAQILANRMSSGHLIAGDVFLMKASPGETAGALDPTTFGGFVSFIDHTQGYLVINGTIGQRPREDGGPGSNEGYIVRINDPERVHTIQQGIGCDGGPNCSPDTRFTNDPSNYTVGFTTGYPACIPSTVTGIGSRTVGSNANGIGDPFCPATNRNWGGPSGREVPDSRRFMPIAIGDDVGGEGNWEVINGVRFFSCHTFGVARKLITRRVANQPDYLTMDEVEWDGPGFQNERNKSLFIGFTTLEDSPVDLFKLYVDPETNENVEYIHGSTIGNLDTTFQGQPPTAGNIFKIGYDIDFIKGAPVVPAHSACQNLLNAGFAVCPNGGTMDEEFSIVSPISREIVARSRHQAEVTPGNEARDILGNIANYGQYITPVGIGHPEFVEIDLDRTDTAMIFAGSPWNLDRRLGPGGCTDANENGVCDENAPLGALGLDPFPYSGLDPRTQAAVPAFAANRIFSHHPFGPGDFVPWPPQNLPDPNVLAFAFAAAPGNRCGIPNELPVAQNDGAGATITTDEDTPLLIAEATLLANDNDADGDSVYIYLVDEGSTGGGTLSLASDGSVTYVPAPDFTGPDNFAYFVSDRHGGTDIALATVTVLPVNDDPVATADDLMTALDTNLVITAAALLANDEDIDGDSVSVTAVAGTGSEGGSITPQGANWLYNPDNNTEGLETFTYTVSDGNGGSDVGELRIHVGNNAPNAVNDAVTTPEDVPRTISVTANDTDSDGDSLTLTAFTQGTRGTVSQIGPASLLYSPDTNENGSDSFTYSITDSRGGHDTATVSVSITAVNDPPVAIADFATTPEDTSVFINVLANDSDPEGSTLFLSLDPNLPGAVDALSVTVVGNQLLYVPIPDLATGIPDSIRYVVSDGQTSSIGVAAISVIPVNDPPVALADVALTLEDVPVTINPIANDLDVENDSLQIISVQLPPAFPATVTFNPLGNMIITPAPNYSNPAGISFGYTVGDGRAQVTSTITLVVLPVNDAPVANNDLGFVTPEDTILTIPVLANDSDVDGNPITIFSTTTPIRGSVTILANGQIRYTPNPNANGNDVFQYTITDNAGGSDNATVSLTITPVNDPPVVNNDGPVPLAEDTVKFIGTALLFANDIDVDGNALTLLSATAPLHGTTALVTGAGGVVTGINYTPAANYFGTDSFIYTARDPSGASDTALVTLQVLPVNDPPVANNDFLVLNQNSSATATPLANDTDADGNPLTISSILVAPLHGSAVVNAGGTITYTPVTGYFGVDHLVYQASDGAGGTDSASLDIVVQQVVSPTTAFIRGDANTDGSINVVDPIQTLFVLFESATPICLVAHDSNDDDQVDVGDIMFSLNFIFSSGQQPGAPYIFCGEDPSAGALDCENFGICE